MTMLNPQNNWYENQQQYIPVRPMVVQESKELVMNNFLDPDVIASLQKNPSFTPKLSVEESYKSVCTHKNNNNITLKRLDPDSNHVVCTSCTEDFHLLDIDTPMEEIENNCERMYDTIQSCKTYLLHTPEEFKQLYAITGLIKKIPQLWKAATKSFSTINNQNDRNIINNNYQPDAFNMLGRIFGTTGMNQMVGANMVPAMAPAAMQQPVYYVQQQPQQAPQQPVYYVQQPQQQVIPPNYVIPANQQQPHQAPQQPVYYVQQQPQQVAPPNYVIPANQQPTHQIVYATPQAQQPMQTPPVQNPIGYTTAEPAPVPTPPAPKETAKVQVPLTSSNAVKQSAPKQGPINPNIKPATK